MLRWKRRKYQRKYRVVVRIAMLIRLKRRFRDQTQNAPAIVNDKPVIVVVRELLEERDRAKSSTIPAMILKGQTTRARSGCSEELL